MKKVILQHDNGNKLSFGPFEDDGAFASAIRHLRLVRAITYNARLPKTSDYIIPQRYPWWERFAGGLNGNFAICVYDSADSEIALPEPLTTMDQGA